MGGEGSFLLSMSSMLYFVCINLARKLGRTKISLAALEVFQELHDVLIPVLDQHVHLDLHDEMMLLIRFGFFLSKICIEIL